MHEAPRQLHDLIARAPDLEGDRSSLLALCDATGVASAKLGEELVASDDLRRSPLSELLPGLPLIQPSALGDRLGARATARLAQADVRTWGSLATFSPYRLLALDGLGVETVEEIVQAAIRGWASAYLRAVASPKSGQAPPADRRGHLMDLLGRAPDPEASRELLDALRDASDPDIRWLVEHLHSDSDLCQQSLRSLMPGLGLVESPYFSIRLSVRAANCLARAKASTLTMLAGMTPAEIFFLPEVGARIGEEILLAVVDEWAASYLASTEDASASKRQMGDKVLVESSSGMAERGRVRSLADAFTKLENASAFAAFRRRQLDSDRLSQSKVAEELGVSGSRISQNERSIRSLLAKRMQDGAWPLSSAVRQLREQLGSVALANELEDALVAIDPSRMVLADGLPHRRALLLWLGGYHALREWVLGPDIELLTKAVLGGLTEDGPADLSFVGRHLARLGVRELVQMPWIISQPGFRIVDDRVVRTSGE